MADKDLQALFLHQLKDTYFAENAIVKALPKMAEAAQTDDLRGRASASISKKRRTRSSAWSRCSSSGREARRRRVQGHPGHHRGRRRGGRGVRGRQRHRCRPDRRRAGGGALRDHPLRHPDGLGQAARADEAEGLIKATLVEEENTMMCSPISPKTPSTRRRPEGCEEERSWGLSRCWT